MNPVVVPRDEIPGMGPKPVAVPDVRRKAARVAAIFDVLAIVVLVLGGLVSGLVGVYGLQSLSFGAVIGAFGGLAATALAWASISLMTVVAGYISQKADR